MIGIDLIKAYREGRRDFTGTNLRGAYLDGANLRKANLGEANLRGANLTGANLLGANLRGANFTEARICKTRLHSAGSWSAPWPRCSAGGWYAWCMAPGIVRIGCTTLPISDWLLLGPDLAEENDVPSGDVHTLRQWLLALDARTEWLGWEENE